MFQGNTHPDPWVSHPHIWKNKVAFFTFLRGALRAAVWNTYPAKIDFKNKHVSSPPPDYVGRAKSGANCALTGQWVNKSSLEVDHIQGNVSLQDWSDVLPFIQHLTCVSGNMQLVSKEAHKVKSHAERQGLTFAAAQADKFAIQQLKLPVAEQRKMLVSHGFTDKQLNTQANRRAAFVTLYQRLNAPQYPTRRRS